MGATPFPTSHHVLNACMSRSTSATAKVCYRAHFVMGITSLLCLIRQGEVYLNSIQGSFRRTGIQPDFTMGGVSKSECARPESLHGAVRNSCALDNGQSGLLLASGISDVRAYDDTMPL